MFVLLALGTAAALGAGRPAQARTPTATGTAAPAPIVTPTAGAPASNKPMDVTGTVWVNAASALTTVQAFVGSTECAETNTFMAPDTYGTEFGISVPSVSDKAGCGQPGAVVSFAVGGVPVDKTVVWQSGGLDHADLVVGPPFARYIGSFTYAGQITSNLKIQPLIDGVICGSQLDQLLGPGPTYDFDVVVLPAELQPGCGRPGATVSFQLASPNGTGKSLTPLANATATAPWEVWEVGQAPPTVGFLDFIALPVAGSGPAPAGDGRWLVSALTLLAGLCGVGLGGIGAGVALRRRATTR